MTTIKVIGLCLALLCLAAWADPPITTPVTLTEEQAISLFFQRNLGLIAAKFNVDQSRADEIIASAIPNPVFSFSVYELSNQMGKDQGDGNKSRFLPAFTPMVQQLIETAGKRGLRMEGAGLGTEASEFDLIDTTRMLTNYVRHAFYALLLAQKSLDVAQDNLDRYHQIMDASAMRALVGDSTA